MSAAESSFYVSGGTLRHDTPSYVDRQADRGLYQGLLRREFCYVLTSRQMGKSSLMVRTASLLRKQNVHVIALDLTAIGQNLTPEQWYDGLAARMGRQLRLEDALDEFWMANQRLSPVQRLFTALREVVLSSRPGPLVVFVDEIDTVRSLPFATDEFFAAIRECYNRRSEDPEFDRLTFCLLGVATPSDLIRDTRTTPFNIGRRIELNDFTEEEEAPLAVGLREDAEVARTLLKRVRFWTNGHPYLTQRLCQAIAADESVKGPAEVDALCDALFLSKRSREQDDNLLFVRERILRSDVDLSSLLHLYGQVHARKRVRNDETNPLENILRLSGITQVSNGCLQVRNRIYEQVFDAEWIRFNMPGAEVRRQQAAFRKGVLRAVLVTAAIVVASAPLALIGLKQSRIAKSQAQRNRELLETSVRLNVANGVQLMEQGDLLGSLMWFVEALRLDRGNPSKEDTHRVRFGSVLEQSPRIVQSWFPLRRMTYGEFDSTGRQVLAAGADGRFRLWNVVSGKPSPEFYGTGHDLERASFSQDGAYVVTCAETEPVVRIWQTATGQQVLCLTNNSNVNHATFNPRGDRILTAGDNHTAVLWAAKTGDKILELNGHAGIVIFATFDSEGRRIVTTSRDGRANIWSAETGVLLTSLTGHDSWVYYAAFSPNGKYVATASFDRTARIWDPVTGNEIFRVQHRDAVRSVEFSPDGRLFVTAGMDSLVRVWNMKTRKQETPPLKDNQKVMRACFSPDGRHVLTVGWNGIIRIWELDATSWFPPAIHSTFSPNGQRFVNGTNNFLEIKDAVSSNLICSFSAGTLPVSESIFNFDGTFLLTICQFLDDSGQTGREASLWNAMTGQAMAKPFQYANELIHATLAFPGNRLAVYGTNQVQVWDCANSRRLSSMGLTNGFVTKVCFDRKGERLVTLSANTVQIWDATTGKTITPPLVHPVPVTHAEFSPNGLLVLTTCSDKTLDPEAAQLWDAATGRQIGRPLQHRDGVLHASFSPDGLRVVTSSEDFTAMIWDVKTGSQLTPPLQHENEVYYASFSRDGRWIVTAGRDQVARVWDSATGDPITPPLKHPGDGYLQDAQFIANDRRLLTRRTNGEMRLWNLPREDRDVATLILIAQLLSGQQGYNAETQNVAASVDALQSRETHNAIETLGGFRPMTEVNVRSVWEKLRAKYPAEFSVRSQ